MDQLQIFHPFQHSLSLCVSPNLPYLPYLVPSLGLPLAYHPSGLLTPEQGGPSSKVQLMSR